MIRSFLAAQAHREVVRVCKQLRDVVRPVEYDLSQIGVAEVKEGYLDGRAVERAIFILRSRGCEWALGEEGGCAMCGHLTGTTRGRHVDPVAYVEQFTRGLETFDFTRVPMLCLYNSGSFLNDREVDAGARRRIFELIAGIPQIEHVIIESRPEFITEEGLAELSQVLSTKTVEIGVGLECWDDEIRDLCLNKGFGRREFLEVAERIGRTPIRLLAYVLLKPPFLCESEAVDEAVRTIEFAFREGADVVSLEPVSVQDFTLVHYLHEAGQFRPPWVWSVFDVIRKTARMGQVRIGGFEYLPIPKIFTHNCLDCDPASVAAIARYNKGEGIGHLGSLSCECMEEWRRDMSQRDGRPLAERVLDIFSSIDGERILHRMRASTTWRDRAEPPRHPRSCGVLYP